MNRKEAMIRSIRTQFTFWYIGSFAVLVLISFGMTEFLFQTVAMQSIDRTISEHAEELEQAILKYLPEDGRERSKALQVCFHAALQNLFASDPVLVRLLTFPKQHSPMVLAQSESFQVKVGADVEQVYRKIQNKTTVFETLRDHDYKTEIRLLSLRIQDQRNQAYILQFGIELSDKVAYQTISLHPLALRPHIFFALFPVIILVGSVWGYFFMKKVFAPVHQVVTIAKNITAEDLSHRIDSVRSNDEIGELAETFNAMIARLERSFKQIQQFSGDVSHELKTPLTVMKGELEVALRKERTPEEYQKILHSLAEETDKLGKIVEDLLFLSRMDAHSIPLSFTDIALDELTLELYEETSRLAAEKQLALNLAAVEHVNVTGDSGLLKRTLLNLILNAVKYTPSGGVIELSVSREADAVVWSIRDTGIGIPSADLPFIFDRFYRVDPSRSHNTGGSGLGLAIVQKIIEAHQGQISVDSEEGRGTTFKIFFTRPAKKT